MAQSHTTSSGSTRGSTPCENMDSEEEKMEGDEALNSKPPVPTTVVPAEQGTLEAEFTAPTPNTAEMATPAETAVANQGALRLSFRQVCHPRTSSSGSSGAATQDKHFMLPDIHHANPFWAADDYNPPTQN